VGGYTFSEEDYGLCLWIAEGVTKESAEFLDEAAFPSISRWYNSMRNRALFRQRHITQRCVVGAKKSSPGLSSNVPTSGSFFHLPTREAFLSAESSKNDAENRKEVAENVIELDRIPESWLGQESIRKDGSKGDGATAVAGNTGGKELTPFLKNKYLTETSKNWNRFYKRNETNFFKDRHYLGKEFGAYIEERCIAVRDSSSSSKKTKIQEEPILCEIGCGVGNSIIPILREFPELRIAACDYSDVAIGLFDERLKELTPVIVKDDAEKQELLEQEKRRKEAEIAKKKAEEEEKEKRKREKIALKNNGGNVAAVSPAQPSPNDSKTETSSSPSNNKLDTSESLEEDASEENDTIIPFARQRVTTFVTDATTALSETSNKIHCYKGRCDVVLLLYCLSAVDPEKHSRVSELIFDLLKPGGILLFRDYGRADWAESRFCDSKHAPAKLKDHLYARQDGTLSYFFTKEDLESETLFGKEKGFETLENRYLFREITNRQSKITMRRIWLQAVFRKSDKKSMPGEKK